MIHQIKPTEEEVVAVSDLQNSCAPVLDFAQDFRSFGFRSEAQCRLHFAFVIHGVTDGIGFMFPSLLRLSALLDLINFCFTNTSFSVIVIPTSPVCVLMGK